MADLFVFACDFFARYFGLAFGRSDGWHRRRRQSQRPEVVNHFEPESFANSRRVQGIDPLLQPTGGRLVHNRSGRGNQERGGSFIDRCRRVRLLAIR